MGSNLGLHHGYLRNLHAKLRLKGTTNFTVKGDIGNLLSNEGFSIGEMSLDGVSNERSVGRFSLACEGSSQTWRKCQTDLTILMPSSDMSPVRKPLFHSA